MVRNARRATDATLGKRAIVIGGSMAGMLAARILAERFEQVLVLERDACPDEPLPRKGAPQGRHAHALLAKGQQVLETLFPGLTQHLLDQGALRGHGRFFSAGGYLHPLKAGPGGLFVSRPLLETAVRARLRALPNVRLVERCSVLGLTADKGRTRICGVQVLRREDDSVAEEMAADLVVDASGRGSRLLGWLEALGYPSPRVELVEVGMGYASRHYRREPEHLDGDLMINIAPTRENKRGCGLLAQEGDRWLVTLAGYFGDHPPTDEAGFLAFARSLPTPDVYNFIRTATPLDNPVAYKFPANQWRHYERLERFLEGLLVVGDALCSFTPIYGQGITVAALEAVALQEVLAGGMERLAARFFAQASKYIGVAWSITVGNDRRLSETYQERSIGKQLINWYMDKLLVAARTDLELAWAFLKVANFLAPPASILHPSIVGRVAWAHLQRWPVADGWWRQKKGSLDFQSKAQL